MQWVKKGTHQEFVPDRVCREYLEIKERLKAQYGGEAGATPK
jgi:hypothetical protein